MIEQRIARLRAFLQEHDADGVIIVQPENLRYFSAFTGGEGALVIGLDQAVLWTDSRYTEQAANQSGTWYDIKNHHNALSSSIRSSLNDMEIGVAGYEENFLTHFMYENISDGALCGFLPCDLTSLRAVKEPYELKATRKASNIADRAFADLLPYIKPGVTEKELAARLESNMLLLGSEEKSFTTIVASGRRSAMPHGTASPKVIEAGDFVTFDGNGNSGRNRNGLFADTRHSKLLSFPYQMYAITSPPTPALRASRSAMTPLEVDTIAVPRPPRTRGSSSLPA